MPLYDKQGNEQYFSFEEIIPIIQASLLYNQKQVQYLGNRSNSTAFSLMQEIKNIKKISPRLRNNIHKAFGMRNNDIERLEKMCEEDSK